MKTLIRSLLLISLLWTQYSMAHSDESFGVLVMAHGGSADWNQGVIDTVAPMREHYNVEIAFGMADAFSIQEAVTKLEANGAQQIAVVRLFISGESWYERTQQILGLVDGAPLRELPDEDHAHGHAEHGAGAMGHRMEFWQIESNAQFAISKDGLADAEQMAQVLLSRANELSENAALEDVLILAHGPEDDEENQRWLANIEKRSELIQAQHNFRSVHVATLREDWEEKRATAETHVRQLIETANTTGGTALIIPYRVHGFGPYEQVFEGLQYRANQTGLIPHSAVTDWIIEQVSMLETSLQHSH